MKVELVDYTGHGHDDPARHAANMLVFTKSTRLNMSPGLLGEIESWPKSRIHEELSYMANTIPSSWEFVNYTFLITGVTRAFTHQFVRTRTGSYAQQTMRVLNVEGWDYLTGPSIVEDGILNLQYHNAMDYVAEAYDELINDGAKIEDARGILPTNILTNIVAGFNLRTVSEMARKRASSRTQGEYRDVLAAMIAEVERVHPWSKIFFGRTFDVAAKELEDIICSVAPLGSDRRTHMIKLIDQLRATAG